MTWHLHHLTGCAPTPLAHYLKALGILRIVGEQADTAARGWWQDEHFCLLTALDRGELERFFLERYRPSPIFNPWGARSGFFGGGSEKTARMALERIEDAPIDRLAPFQKEIRKVRAVVAGAGNSKPDTDEAKFSLIKSLRQDVRGAGEEWLGSVMALVGDSYRTPALLGTGGNEGSRSYTSAFLNAVVSCVIDRSVDHALGLFACADTPRSGPLLDFSWSGSFGQYMPDGWGSAWDFLLALEGALVFRSAVALRSQSTYVSSGRFVSSPFYFAPHAVGSGSVSAIDEFSLNKGKRYAGRGEQWFPVWAAPTGFFEVRALIAEGRCSIAGRHVGRSIDAARAIGRVGVARGLTGFCRYGYLQRNNLATHFAVPLGRIDVRERVTSRIVDDIAKWLWALHGAARRKNATHRVVEAEARLADAVFAALTHDNAPDRWQSVLLAATDVEAVQASGTAFEAGPIPDLSPDWVVAADDGSAEWRLACALGSAAAGYDRMGRPHDPVRHHWLPLEERRSRFKQKEKRLVRDVRVVISGRDPVADLPALVERRVVEGVQRGPRQLALVAARGCEAHPSDLALLIAGSVDLRRVSALARALMAVRWNLWKPPQPARREGGGAWPDEPWVALRLASLPWALDDRPAIPLDEAMVRRLVAGDGGAAVQIAVRRLRASGLRPPLRAACVDSATARLWAAALAFPISRASARAMLSHFELTDKKEIR